MEGIEAFLSSLTLYSARPCLRADTCKIEADAPGKEPACSWPPKHLQGSFRG